MGLDGRRHLRWEGNRALFASLAADSHCCLVDSATSVSLRPHSSLARSPAPARTATRARSRSGHGSRATGSRLVAAARTAPSSSSVSATGSRRGCAGRSISAVGSATSSPRWTSHRHSAPVVDRTRLREDGARPSRASSAKAPRIAAALRSASSAAVTAAAHRDRRSARPTPAGRCGTPPRCARTGRGRTAVRPATRPTASPATGSPPKPTP